jgi:hypothetical protein
LKKSLAIMIVKLILLTGNELSHQIG